MLAHKLTDEYIRTDFEVLFQRGLDSLKVKYRTGIIFCFTCKKTFTWLRSEVPEQCMRGLHRWTEPGEFARPDFLIYGNDRDEQPLACVRIDGAVHDKRNQRVRDKFQAQAFINIGIKVFVFRNSWLLGAEHIVGKKVKKWVPIQLPDFIYTAYASVVIMCCKHDDLYRKYLADREVKHYLQL